MEQKFLSSFSKISKHDDLIILAVSGGVDSMVLFDLILKHHPREKIIIAHFDHSLRGVESDEDREFIANICNKEKITFEFEKMDIASVAKKEKMSIEGVARKYRYEFLDRVAKKYSAKYILSAHHSDDRIETAMFNLIRGTKLGGIHALSMLTSSHCEERSNPVHFQNSIDYPIDAINPHREKIIIFRPLLEVSKKDIREYATKNNIQYREDSTNHSSDYQRNYLRHGVLPTFEKINPEYRRSISNFIDYTKELKAWIDTEVSKFLGGKKEFSAIEFEKQSPFFQKEIIRYLFEEANNGTVGLSEGNIEEILRFITTAEGGTFKMIHSLILSKKHHIIGFTSGPFRQQEITPSQDS